MRMDQVTQQNAALVEEAAAAASSLQDQTARMRATVAVFRLDASPADEPRAAQLAMPRPPMKTRLAGA